MKKNPETLADLVKDGGFDQEKWSTADNVKIVPSDLVTTQGEPKLYRFEYYSYLNGDLLKRIDGDGYRLGTLGDLIAYAKNNPEEQRHYNIFSLRSALEVNKSHPEDHGWKFPYIGVDCLDKKLRILSSRVMFPFKGSGTCNLSSEDRIIAVPKEQESVISPIDTKGNTFEVDFSKQPHVPKGWIVLPESKQIKTRVQGKIELSASSVGLYRDKSQMYRNEVIGLELKKKLEDTPVFGAQLLDFLIDNRQFIPDILKDEGAHYYFWGTLYMNEEYMPCVRYLYYGTIDKGKGAERNIEWCAPTSGYLVLRGWPEQHPYYYVGFEDPAVILV